MYHKNLSHFGWAIVLTALISLTMVGRASAHAYLVRSDPAANDILDSAPATMRLWFSEPVSAAFSGARLLSAGGQATDVTSYVDSTDSTLLVVNLPELSQGVYSLRWAVHSAADGHLTQGLIVFGIGQGADLGTATAVATDTAVPWPEIILRWLIFSFYAGLIGAFAVTYLVLNPDVQPDAIAVVQRAAQKRILELAWWSSLLALAAGFAWVGWQAAALADSSFGSISITAAGWQWLSQTRLGYLWWARQAILLIVAVNLWPQRFSSTETAVPTRSGQLTGILLLLLLLSQSLTSHAAALTADTAMAVAADTLHLLAASFWVGELLALVVGLLPLVRQRADFTALVKAGWQPFGKWAALSVGILIVTGIYSTSREVGSPNAMVTTFYGRVLLLKIGLVLMIGLIGAANSTMFHPRLAAPLARLLHKPAGWTPLSLRRFPRLVVTEVCVGLLVFLLAGLVTAVPTARGFSSSAVAAADLSQTIGDMFIKLNVSPNQAGQNIFTVRAVSTRRPAPAEITRVILRFTYLDQDLGLVSADMANVEPDLYVLGGNQLFLAGNWQIDVVVRRQGVEDSVAQFKWTVPQKQ
ncbi:MAG: copper resistance protein CopC/CopD [Ardenticatenaceae bacterium]|nr:copper resistance protein CopC/CopD [Ardenticatenaceae bacterium]MCB9445263.1 copper resistance protein CopC/CopD [Ardenticatenaceae bacterium]